MNRPQRIILAIAFIYFSAMTIFPPWVYIHTAPIRVERPAGYRFLFGQHTPQDIDHLTSLFGLNKVEFTTDLQYFALRLDGTRVLTQTGLGIFLTVILLLAFQKRRRNAE